MPFVYGISPAANQATSATPNTEVDGLFVAAGATASVAIQSLFVCGKGAALTAISGIIFRIKWWTTASTAGSAITPTPRGATTPASICTAASGPTAGTGGGTYQLAIGCGAAGPGGWVALNAASMPSIRAASGDSLDVYNASGTASLNYEQSLEVVE